MAGTDPLKIIEQQLAFLQARSDKNLLTYDEVVQLATLVKAREFILAKGSGAPTDSDLDELSDSALKQLLKALD